jgi:hypothetical protein
MRRAFAIVFTVAMVGLTGCASPTASPQPSALRGDNLQRVVIVGSGDSKFTMARESTERGRKFNGIVDEVAKWIPNGYGAMLAPIAKMVYSTISSIADAKGGPASVSHAAEVSPRSVVADAFARRLQASGQFAEVRAVEREPVGDERRRADAIIRLTVPAWGLVRVREGKPDLLASYADVRAQVVVRETGTVVWEHEEDVTHAGRLPLQAFTRDGELARQELLDVLERAGQRVASEFLYARGAGR